MAVLAYEGCSSDDSVTTPAANDAGFEASGADATPDAGADSGASVDANAADTGADAAPAIDAGDDAADAGSIDCTDDAGSGLPTHLQCTGLYSDWNSKTVSSDVRAFTPAYPLWSDGALKSRWIFLPPGTQIDNSDPDEWVFPVGTKTWKEFRLGTQRIETRMFLKASSGWQFTTYRWSTDEKSATRLDTGETNVNGTTYEVPSVGQCATCHNGRKDKVLGFEAFNLGAASTQGTTLETLIADGVFTKPMQSAIEIPNDSTNLARGSFGWLHTNCGVTCHNRNATASAVGSGLYLRMNAGSILDGGISNLHQTDPFVTAVDVTPKNAVFAGQGYKRIKTNDPDLSLIPLFDGTRGSSTIPQMPPIVSHQVPTNDVAALKAWITAMPDGG